MKKLLLSTAALLALLGSASAQDRRDGGDRGDRGGDRQSHAPAAAPQPAAPAAAPGRADQPHGRSRAAAAPAAPAANAMRPGPGNNNGRNTGGPDRTRNDNAYRPGNNNSAMHGPSRGAVNYSQYHRNFSASHRFRAPNYRRPAGWYSHRWVFGERLPSAFFGRDYWINDFVDFDLMPPPPGTVWVRYGSDALLIDQYTGEVVQVEYSVFY